MHIENTSVLITGGSRGLGAALGAELARSGARIVLVARSEIALREVVSRIRAEGGEAHALSADLGDKESIHRIVGAAAGLIGPVEVLVNGAATLGPLPMPLLLDTPCEALEAVLQENLLGPFRLAKAVLGSMALRGSGSDQRHVRRCGHPLSGLGRVRRVEGGSRASHPDLGGRARGDERADLERRSGGDGHAHARGRRPGRRSLGSPLGSRCGEGDRGAHPLVPIASQRRSHRPEHSGSSGASAGTRPRRLGQDRDRRNHDGSAGQSLGANAALASDVPAISAKPSESERADRSADQRVITAIAGKVLDPDERAMAVETSLDPESRAMSAETTLDPDRRRASDVRTLHTEVHRNPDRSALADGPVLTGGAKGGAQGTKEMRT
jgi:hypothetical protein